MTARQHVPSRTGPRRVVLACPPWLAGDAAFAVDAAARAAGWPCTHDDAGNTRWRSPDGRARLGYVPEPPRGDPYRRPAAQEGTADHVRGIWTVRARLHEAAAWSGWFNDGCLVPSGEHVPQEMVAAVLESLAVPGRTEPDALADPGNPETVWQLLREAAWHIDHFYDDTRVARSPDATAALECDTPEAGWRLRVRRAPTAGRVLWKARFTPSTPAFVIAAVMRAMTAPGLPRCIGDLPAWASVRPYIAAPAPRSRR
ncbi:DUF317 domain-containing protein [Yinghuangia seranimata]|uniref:DUF317 domain-containing protein n=1 Tax=Yinghuangia seranimata TaxID=408067 RepID=UPI00248CEDF5|nr:DUF317 domain-containing protein [Yinghuangia seranimata]MDI2130590.1 DUF317 domain-containing protein [Yinghuangia seranimata]